MTRVRLFCRLFATIWSNFDTFVSLVNHHFFPQQWTFHIIDVRTTFSALQICFITRDISHLKCVHQLPFFWIHTFSNGIITFSAQGEILKVDCAWKFKGHKRRKKKLRKLKEKKTKLNELRLLLKRDFGDIVQVPWKMKITVSYPFLCKRVSMLANNEQYFREYSSLIKQFYVINMSYTRFNSWK